MDRHLCHFNIVLQGQCFRLKAQSVVETDVCNCMYINHNIYSIGSVEQKDIESIQKAFCNCKQTNLVSTSIYSVAWGMLLAWDPYVPVNGRIQSFLGYQTYFLSHFRFTLRPRLATFFFLTSQSLPCHCSMEALLTTVLSSQALPMSKWSIGRIGSLPTDSI